MIEIPKIEYSNWLNTFVWSHFCTFTTDYTLTMGSARRAMERFYNFIRHKIPKVRIFWAAEQFNGKCGYHIHALVYLGINIEKNILNSFITIKNAWAVVSKGNNKNFNVVDRYDKNLGANFYVAKHLAGDNYDILGFEST